MGKFPTGKKDFGNFSFNIVLLGTSNVSDAWMSWKVLSVRVSYQKASSGTFKVVELRACDQRLVDQIQVAQGRELVCQIVEIEVV